MLETSVRASTFTFMVFNRSIFCQLAKHHSPEKLPPNVYFSHTKFSVTIFDAYPKAEYHLLIIPRISRDETDKVRTAENLISLKKLFSVPGTDRREIRDFLTLLKEDADSLREELEEDMRIRRGFVWKLNFGFHAVQSME